MSQKRLVLTIGALALGAWLGGTQHAMATMDMQKKAKAAGIAANNCQYCHNEKLPKKGASTNNARGLWLVAEKEKRQAKDIDVAWLKDYTEKAEDKK
jgi:hypothetical protein